MSGYDHYGGLPPHQPTDTSLTAAAQALPLVNRLQARVLQYLRERADGATDIEIQEALQLNPSTQRPRRIELVQKGLVEDSRMRRRTPSGRSAVVWRAVPPEPQQLKLMPEDPSC